MLDDLTFNAEVADQRRFERAVPSRSILFWGAKRALDMAISCVLLLVLLWLIAVLVVLNPFLNRGRLFFIQTRMGKNCKPFKAIKFRTMTHVTSIVRGYDDPIEVDRITRLGGWLRKSRLDEVPQILNVLRGEMSLIGPRPDFFEHAQYFVEHVPGYRDRHQIRPGISGLAQVNLGYAEGLEATKAKTNADRYYLNNAGFSLDFRIGVKTLLTMLFRAGA